MCSYKEAIDYLTLLSWWLQSREALPESFRRGFDSLTMLVTWGIWKERCRRVFERKQCTPERLTEIILSAPLGWLKNQPEFTVHG